jgi:hypothetical protein
MAARAHRPLRRAVAEATYLIDSTGLRLDRRSLDWARFSAKVYGVELHLVYDADADRPIYAAITPARVNDILRSRTPGNCGIGPMTESSTWARLAPELLVADINKSLRFWRDGCGFTVLFVAATDGCQPSLASYRPTDAIIAAA